MLATATVHWSAALFPPEPPRMLMVLLGALLTHVWQVTVKYLLPIVVNVVVDDAALPAAVGNPSVDACPPGPGGTVNRYQPAHRRATATGRAVTNLEHCWHHCQRGKDEFLAQ
ncbi:hypothetical protein CCHOA_08490 [Corynebacterium choanae]|uniref:Uncharacterized protein n=1 Tax=Corynebacterium choanae TaxID=1862358 RepID=A0A3G6J7Q3_9CORY|nr:hypothetical protein CCHOA_08490 [Corynebacterium choanae]